MAKIFNQKRKLTPLAVFVAAAMVVSTGMVAKTSTARVAYATENSQNCIVPKPVSYKQEEGSFVLTQNASIYVKGNGPLETKEIKKVAQILKQELKASTGFELNIIEGEEVPDGSIYLTTVRGDEEDGDEGYAIVTTEKNIKVVAYKPEGISRGIQTLKQLFPADIEKENVVTGIEWKVPVTTIKDKPEYSYRGAADIHVKIGHMLELISIMWLFLVSLVLKQSYLSHLAHFPSQLHNHQNVLCA